MALTTDLRRFAAYVPTRAATTCMIQGGAGGGGAKVASSPTAHGSVRSGVAGDSGADQGSPGVQDARGVEETRDIETTETVPAETPHAVADVLVVDDDADVRWTVAEILRSA